MEQRAESKGESGRIGGFKDWSWLVVGGWWLEVGGAWSMRVGAWSIGLVGGSSANRMVGALVVMGDGGSCELGCELEDPMIRCAYHGQKRRCPSRTKISIQ
ncbi:hypothetical protein EYV94_08090 [Puteibacter caeruleilacunae]|nr:hypothetical protein EYV94_08090 [Puteibacter caeruleilacunae]